MQLKQGCSGVWIAAAVAIADQLSKVIVRRMSAPRVLLPGLLAARPTTNTGVAFSMLSGSGLPLIIATAVLTAAITCWLIARPKAQTPLLRASLWMIVGGGLGNLYDRIVYGRVTDFIELLFVDFAIFNLADVFICVGAFLAALTLWRSESKKEFPNA